MPNLDEDTRTPEQRAADDEVRFRAETRKIEREARGLSALDIECPVCRAPGKLRVGRGEAGKKRLEHPAGWIPVHERSLRMSACTTACADALYAQLRGEL